MGHIGSIRAKYLNDVAARDVLKKQLAVAIYLIDRLAFRAGYEKIVFSGEDSTCFQYTTDVDVSVGKAIRQLHCGKSKTDKGI
ncbi:predicted protein [Arabidopsis lyrata subsp. lyrata]|uniref:Predicted protein n=1 Tax=Arabidopsis lyrata subsp. lyrata TaxID=81972 RepID=D7L8M1_ARALL|nr:predicted protein [Arabidopsis lyrata subsp. lyrata]